MEGSRFHCQGLSCADLVLVGEAGVDLNSVGGLRCSRRLDPGVELCRLDLESGTSLVWGLEWTLEPESRLVIETAARKETVEVCVGIWDVSRRM